MKNIYLKYILCQQARPMWRIAPIEKVFKNGWRMENIWGVSPVDQYEIFCLVL